MEIDRIRDHLLGSMLTLETASNESIEAGRKMAETMESHYVRYKNALRNGNGAGNQTNLVTQNNEIFTGGARLATFDYTNIDLTKVINPKTIPAVELDSRDRLGNWNGKGIIQEFASVVNHKTRKRLQQYVYTLVQNDLANQLRIPIALVNESNTHGVYICVDYYASRAGLYSFHKDTQGITLFAVLHYLNQNPQIGPEWFFDTHPYKTTGEQYSAPSTNFRAPVPGSIYNGRRTTAPWKISNGMTHWPIDLIKGLESARSHYRTNTLPSNDFDINHSTMGANGLACFVDELIYHSSPLKISRAKAHYTDNRANEGGGGGNAVNTKVTLPHTRVRRMSFALDEGDVADPDVGVDGRLLPGRVRNFFRLWVCVAPRAWYTPINMR